MKIDFSFYSFALFARISRLLTAPENLAGSIQFLARGNLAGLQERLDELAVATNGHTGKCLEPGTVRHLGFSIKPVRHQPQLVGGIVAAANPVKQMIEKVWRKMVTPDPWHGYSP